MREALHAELEESSAPSLFDNSAERGRDLENRLINSPEMCSQSAALPPFPHSKSLLPD